MPRISARTRLASGSRFSTSAQPAWDPEATTWSPRRTSLIVPISAPHSVRSITTTSAGYSRLAIWLSSTHWKSAP